MKATTGWTPYSGITNTNSSGFTGLPGGFCAATGIFYDIDTYGFWWSSSEFSSTYSWYLFLSYGNSYSTNAYDYKTAGCSVRFIRD